MVDNKYYFLYKLTNKINNKVYIGQTININKRFSSHKSSIENNKPTQVIHRAIIFYGKENFDWNIIATCRSLDDANSLEEILIIQYQSHISMGRGYNVSLGGKNASKSEEFKKQISSKLKGHPVSQETRNLISKSNMGRIITQEHRKKISDGSKGRTNTEESKQKQSLLMKNPKINKGLEKLKQISDSHKGMTWIEINKKRVWIDKPDIKEKSKIASSPKPASKIKKDLPEEKQCSKCPNIKPASEFNKRTDDGLASWCKACYNEYRKELRAKKKEAIIIWHNNRSDLNAK